MPTSPPRIFLAHSRWDTKFREVIVAKATAARIPVVFEFMPDSRPDDPVWQNACRDRIRSCQAMILLVSVHLRRSAGVLWQIGCAREEQLPTVGISVGLEKKRAVPNGVIEEDAIISWKWNLISTTLVRLVDEAGDGDRQKSLIASETTPPEHAPSAA